jgi:hypothetical protein
MLFEAIIGVFGGALGTLLEGLVQAFNVRLVVPFFDFLASALCLT